MTIPKQLTNGIGVQPGTDLESSEEHGQHSTKQSSEYVVAYGSPISGAQSPDRTHLPIF